MRSDPVRPSGTSASFVSATTPARWGDRASRALARLRRACDPVVIAGSVLAVVASTLLCSAILTPFVGLRRLGRWLQRRWGWQWPSQRDGLLWTLGSASLLFAWIADHPGDAPYLGRGAMLLALLCAGLPLVIVHVVPPTPRRVADATRRTTGTSADRD